MDNNVETGETRDSVPLPCPFLWGFFLNPGSKKQQSNLMRWKSRVNYPTVFKPEAKCLRATATENW